jgi:hypothetical protein
MPDGKSFMILRPKAFVAEVLPKHFKQAKYSSFTRKLHRWGFQRHLRGEAAGAFHHRDFQRGRIDLAERMTCAKKTGDAKASRGETPTGGASFGSPEPAALPFARTGMSSASDYASSMFSSPPSQLQLQQQLEQLRKQQQLLQQQQQQIAAQQQEQAIVEAELRSPMQSVATASGVDEGPGSVDRLNAAIELEVSRRLQERLMNASLSRQALSMMPPAPQMDTRSLAAYSTFGSPASQAMMNWNLFGKNPLCCGPSTCSSSQYISTQAIRRLGGQDIGRQAGGADGSSAQINPSNLGFNPRF